MKGRKILTVTMKFILLGAGAIGAFTMRLQHPVQPPQPAYPAWLPAYVEPTAIPSPREIKPIAFFPLNPNEQAEVLPPAGLPGQSSVINTTTFTTTLYSGQVEKYTLGPCTTDGGYLVDVTPLEGSTDGAHIEKQVLPEFDGEMWVDVLSLLLPEPAAPVNVQVELGSTVGWPVAFQQTLRLYPGDWSGFIIQEARQEAGYVIEINPLSAGEYGDRVERAIVQPEFPPATWWDVLRLQIPATQVPLTAEVVIYQTSSEIQIATTYELAAEPGVWYGVALGRASDRAAYIVEVTPLIYADNQVERYTVQPEFDGHTWNDVVRVMLSSDRPQTTLQVTVYRILFGQR